VGYSDKHKGYKCFHPLSRNFFISHHVIFDELFFPYKNTQNQSIIQPTLVLDLIGLVLFFLNMDFFCSLVDSSLFILHSNLGTLILLLYVDDILLTGSSTTLVSTFIQLLSSEFTMEDLGQIHHFLGIEISQTSGSLHMSQSHYALTILERANMVDYKPISTPLEAKTKTSSNNVLLEDLSYFRGLVGALQYLTLTRPDLTYSVNYAS